MEQVTHMQVNLAVVLASGKAVSFIFPCQMTEPVSLNVAHQMAHEFLKKSLGALAAQSQQDLYDHVARRHLQREHQES